MEKSIVDILKKIKYLFKRKVEGRNNKLMPITLSRNNNFIYSKLEW